MSKYGGFSDPNVAKYGPEKPQYLDTFHAVNLYGNESILDIYRHFEGLLIGKF